MNPWLGAALVAGGMWLAASIPFALYAAHILWTLEEVELDTEWDHSVGSRVGDLERD